MLEKLKDIGLTEKEIEVLRALIENEELSILQLSKLTKISRTYCYEALEKLMQKGLVAKVVLNNKTAWKANPVERIMSHLEVIKEEIRQDLMKLKQKTLVKDEGFKINLYKGKKGIKAICDRELESKTDVIGWGAEGQLEQHLPFYYEYFKNECLKRKLKANFIVMKPLSKLAKVNVNTKYCRKYFDTSVEVNIFDDHILIFFWKENPEAIEIISKDVANSFRNYHKLFWEKL
jgi:sugar-specific transcriptional regulator TrmB